MPPYKWPRYPLQLEVYKYYQNHNPAVETKDVEAGKRGGGRASTCRVVTSYRTRVAHVHGGKSVGFSTRVECHVSVAIHVVSG